MPGVLDLYLSVIVFETIINCNLNFCFQLLLLVYKNKIGVYVGVCVCVFVYVDLISTDLAELSY